MAKTKQVKWKLTPQSKRPPLWVLHQTGCDNKADLVAKYGSKKTFVQ